MSDNNEFQDQGALDEPQKETDGPFNRITDVHAGPHEGGPVNPVRGGLGSPDEDQPTLAPQEADPTVEPDNSSASTLAQAKEDVPSGNEQPSYDPPGTGVAADPADL